MELLFSILKLREAKAILLSLQQKKITLKVNLTVYLLFKRNHNMSIFFAIRLNNWQFLEMTQAIHYWEFFKTLVKCDVTFWIISWVDYSVRGVSSPFFWVPDSKQAKKKFKPSEPPQLSNFCLEHLQAKSLYSCWFCFSVFPRSHLYPSSSWAFEIIIHT